MIIFFAKVMPKLGEVCESYKIRQLKILIKKLDTSKESQVKAKEFYILAASQKF